jgi:hypothetical protein
MKKDTFVRKIVVRDRYALVRSIVFNRLRCKVNLQATLFVRIPVLSFLVAFTAAMPFFHLINWCIFLALFFISWLYKKIIFFGFCSPNPGTESDKMPNWEFTYFLGGNKN